MHTEKLYYRDCHQDSFTAQVLSCQPAKGGFAVILDQTAFYPEGGGQACDWGRLNDVHVLDVQEQDEQILHLCDSALPVGETVFGQIDKNRRFDLMQQHSGEHIFSGIVHSLLGHHNVGFHVGSDRMEIDFDGPITPEQLLQIETLANRAVWENLPINCWYPSEAELPNVFYRTKKVLPWPVRIVQIPGYDSCACCGVHVERTGEIGLIKVISCIKFHQGVRIELCCGGRALQLMQRIFEENRQVSAAFSAQMLSTGSAAKKMNEALAAEKLRANTLQSQLFDKIAEEYVGFDRVVRFQEELTTAQVRELADKIAPRCTQWAAVLSGQEGNYSICVLGDSQKVNQVSTMLKERFSARGGGKSGSFQGSICAARVELEAALLAL